jgi:deoxyribodipyrimidine photo-lyase
MCDFFKENNISWKESQMHGVIRKLKSRQNWDKRWEDVMRAEPNTQ